MERSRIFRHSIFAVFLIIGVVYGRELADSHVVTSSPMMEIEIGYSKEAMASSHGKWQRKDQQVPQIEGNWFVEWHDTPEKGQAERAALTLFKTWEMREELTKQEANRWYAGRKQEEKWLLEGWRGENFEYGYQTVTPQVTGGTTIEIGHPYFVLGHWGGSSTVRMVGPDRIEGEWSYNEKGGKEIWNRAHPRIEHVKFLSDIERVVAPGGVGRVEKKFDSYWWGPSVDMRGNRPNFFIEVYGQNFWGHHVVDLDGAVDLEPLGFQYIWADSTPGWPNSVVGLKVEVIIWDQVFPGRKVLVVDGVEFPFDFVVKGFPHTYDATLKVEIVPQLKKAGLKTHYADLEVIDDHLEMSEGLGRITKWLLRREAEKFVKELEKWTAFLSNAQLVKLMANRELLVDVAKPYRVLKRFEGGPLEVPVQWEWPKREELEKTVELSFVRRGEFGFVDVVRVPRDEPFWIEAEFSEAPEENVKTVTLEGGVHPLEVEVTRTDELSTLYRSRPFVVNSLYGDELDETP